jgi:phosphatidylglycerol lysyltransferase
MPLAAAARNIVASTMARRLGGIAAFGLVAALVLMVAHRLVRDLDYHTLVHGLRHTSGHVIALAVVATAASFLSLIAREVCALRYAQARAPWPAVLLAGFCGSALRNAVGLAGLTGAGVRYRIYSAVGIRPDAVVRIIVFAMAGSGIGLVWFFAASALVETTAIADLFHWSAKLLAVLSILLLAASAGFVLLGRDRMLQFQGVSMQMPGTALALGQLALTAIDVICAAAALWVLLPASTIDFGSFVPVFAAATALGVISHVPGGLGIFEAIVLLALRRHASPDLIAAALVAYRAIYFVLPLLLSTALLAGYEVRRLADVEAAGPEFRLIGSAARLTPSFLAALTFAAGIMLVASGATPAFPHRLTILSMHLPLWSIEASHFLGSIAGVLLLFIARGLFHRLDGAWWLAVVLSLAALGLSLAKGLAYTEASALAVLFILLVATRKQFTRRASLLAQSFTTAWFVAIASVLTASALAFAFAFQDVRCAHELWWQFELDAEAPRALRAMLGACVVAIAIGCAHLLRLAQGTAALPDAAALSRARTIIRAQQRSEALLALMGDKSLMFSISGEALLMFARRGKSWIALFDPIGPRGEWTELIWRFVELAATSGGRAAFYQVRPDSLPFYIDAGLRIVKIGEEARIALPDYHLQGSRRSSLRYALKRGEREGLAFEMLSPDQAVLLMPALEEISAAWLDAHDAREKGFSVAAFEPGYVATQSVALVRQNGSPVAFVTIMATDERSEATIGLMRHIPDTSPYTMEFLFVRLILALKDQRYQVLSLGMAPLSGLSRTRLAQRWYRLGNLIWSHGNMLYNFQGLRTFKSKFDPQWEPRYLAVSGSMGPLFALADVAALTSTSPIGRPRV